MKSKLLLSALFFLVVLTSNAQINKGRYLIGGGLNLYNAKYVQNAPSSSYKNIYTNIQFGKVIKENTVVGVILSYGDLSNNYTNIPDSNFYKNHQYSAGVFYRKYKRFAKDFYFFGQVDAVYVHSESSQTQYFQNVSTGLKSISNGGSVSFFPGISYRLYKRMQVELVLPDIFRISYSHIKTDYNSSLPPIPLSEKGNIFSVSTNLNANFLASFGVGFKFLLGK